MKLLDFGSLNVDHVYRLEHLVREGETIASSEYHKNEGGKGLNQAVALAKAEQEVYFAGAIGADGEFLRDFLSSFGVKTDYLKTLGVPTGHAIIQVDDEGRNSIILYGGANQKISAAMIDETLSHFASGDYLLTQNEINCTAELIERASARGMTVVLNPSPITPELLDAPLNKVDWFILNEIEGRDITGETESEEILRSLTSSYPDCHALLTLGENGSVYAHKSLRAYQPAIPTLAADSTAAGDTFTGYFLKSMLGGETIERALLVAAQAASITVSRPGAGRSIPVYTEVMRAMGEA